MLNAEAIIKTHEDAALVGLYRMTAEQRLVAIFAWKVLYDARMYLRVGPEVYATSPTRMPGVLYA